MPQPTIKPLIKITSFIGRGRGGGGSGGGGGVLSSSGQFGSPELNELRKIRLNLVTLLDIEKAQTKYLGDRILKFARSDERKKLKKRESAQETKKGTQTKSDTQKNPIVKGFFNGLQGLFSFFGNIFKAFLGYKILEWVAKPENEKKVQDFVKLIGGIFKFISAVAGFGIDKLLGGISKILDGGGITRIFGFLEAVVGFFTLKWLLNPTKIISDIAMIGNLFTKTIPNAINAVVNFFTKIIPGAAASAADDALKESAKGVGDASKTAVKGVEGATTAAAKTGTAVAKTGATAAKGAAAGAAKGGAKITGKSLLKALPIIGAVSSGIFAADRAFKGDWLGAGMEVASGAAALIPGWGTAASLGIDAALIGRDIAKEQGIPMLAKGGIVTKPTQAIVGEAGPEAILPLDKLGSFVGLNKSVSDTVPKFMKLLTIPFTIVGAGLVSLISSSLSLIPGIGPLLTPIIGSIASTFGIPSSIVTTLGKVSGGVASLVSSGASGLAEIFGLKDPSVNMRAGSRFTLKKDNSIRGLLANILGALVSKLPKEKEVTPAPAPTAPAGGAPASSPSPAPSPPPAAAAPPASPTPPKNNTGSVGGYGIGDKVPALLEPGEYVLNKNAVQGVGGAKVLDHINHRVYPRFQTGGSVTLLTSGGGTSALKTPVQFTHLRPHHGTGDSNRAYGITKDYILDGSKYPNYKVPTPVAASVKFAGSNPGGYGNMVELTDDKGRPLALFGHFSKLMVKTGDKLSAGDILGIQGSTGKSSGPHVHIDASKKFHETWANYVLGVKSSLDASSLVNGPGLSGQDRTTDSDSEQQEDPEIWNKLAASLQNLFKAFNPSDTPASTPVAPAAKIDTTPSSSSQTLQSVQKQNNQIQSQNRQTSAKPAGNVVTVGNPNQVIQSSATQPITPSLGANLPPVSTILTSTKP